MISIVRLISGIEIIGDVSLTDNSRLIMNEPLQVVYFPRPGGLSGIMLQRYNHFSVQEQFTFNKLHVESIGEPIESMVKYYHDILRHIKKNIDPGIAHDLDRMHTSMESEGDNAAGMLDGDDREVHLAMIEKRITKKPLN